MTSAPVHDGYVEDEESCLPHMPFDAAHSLLRLGWHESWYASLTAVSELDGSTGQYEERRKGHKKLAEEARETWNVLALPWASGPRGGQRGAMVVDNVRILAQAAAQHCAAMRVYKEKAGKSATELQQPAHEPYKRFDAAKRTLGDMHGTLAHALFERIVELLWATGWHAANTVGEADELNEEEEEEAEEDDEGEDDEQEDEDEDEDEETPFGDDYPGSSDDPVENMRDILDAFHKMFHDETPFRGVRCSLVSETEGSPSVLETISRVPGAFGEPGLNAVRLLLPDWSGCTEALDSTASVFLMKAEAEELSIVLELPAVPGKPYEDWLRGIARAVQEMKCVKGVALPRVQDLTRAAGLLSALRQGGLTQDRCSCFLQLPEGRVEECQEKLYQSTLAECDADQLPLWLADGNVLLETAAHVQLPDKVTPQTVLDAASKLSEEHEHLDLISTWSLALPGALPKLAAGANESELIREFGQRLLAAMDVAKRGWFFESWNVQNGESAAQQSLKICLERGWLNLGAEDQVMYPHGSHTKSLVYLHGFTCNGYDYLKEPHYVYRLKPVKKKKKAKKDEEEDDADEFEPFPGLKVVFPSAPKREISCYKGEILHAWYDYMTDYEGEREDELSMEDLEQTTARVHALLDAEAAAVGAENVFLGGASQGCGTALHIALTYPGQLGGVIGTMGHLLSCTPVNKDWVAKKIPIFVYNGLADTMMLWEEWVKATYRRLEDAGADIRIALDEGVDHGENEDSWMRHFLTEMMKSRNGAVASILSVNRNEARVLSSKARAPYMVMMEVEEKPMQTDRPTGRGILGRLCASRKSPVQATHHFAAVPPKFWPPEDSPPASARNMKDPRPKGAFHDETWTEVVCRVRARSEFGRRPNWSMIPMIVKSNADDVRQEELAYRLLKWFERVFKRHNPKLWLQPFLIIATTHDGGVLEVVTNAISISDLKKSYGSKWESLKRYFEESFTGDDRPHGFAGEKSVSFRTATMNFIYSMAAYSVVCYVLAIRDRHNGNIMLNDEGHVLHVDFGFMLCGAPGGKAMQHIGGFEHSAGFKLTNELVEVLGPIDGNEFQVFRSAILDGMRAVRSHAQELLALVQVSMLGSENSQMNCFCHPRGYPEAVLEDICDRLGLPGGVRNGGDRKISDEEFRQSVNRMIDDSIDHWRSRLYDTYQYHFVGVH
ncbi:unnamed protein product [Effrenium voratum]|nr:unnamed protein product [Effrenium voratum]